MSCQRFLDFLRDHQSAMSISSQHTELSDCRPSPRLERGSSLSYGSAPLEPSLQPCKPEQAGPK